MVREPLGLGNNFQGGKAVTCKCGKPADIGMKYCSAECSPYGAAYSSPRSKTHAEPHYENDESTWGAIDSSAFKAGADWQAKQILELLRSDEALQYYYDYLLRVRPEEWADWLESKWKKDNKNAN